MGQGAHPAEGVTCYLSPAFATAQVVWRGGNSMAAVLKSKPVHGVGAEEEHPALDAILGANPFVGIDATQIAGTLARVVRHLTGRPRAVVSRVTRLSLELAQ